MELIRQMKKRVMKETKGTWVCKNCCHTTSKVSNPYTGADDWNGVIICPHCNANMERIEK
jgi:hypothetical protein